eukprot:scaffold34621_cov166-Amphora_coffeaeformis.AAC.16
MQVPDAHARGAACRLATRTRTPSRATRVGISAANPSITIKSYPTPAQPNRNMTDNNPREIKEKILALGVGPSDLARFRGSLTYTLEFTSTGKDTQDEFNVILRKSADLKNFCDPGEFGYASRIREINRAQRVLREKIECGEIQSFSDILKYEA